MPQVLQTDTKDALETSKQAMKFWRQGTCNVQRILSATYINNVCIYYQSSKQKLIVYDILILICVFDCVCALILCFTVPVHTLTYVN